MKKELITNGTEFDYKLCIHAANMLVDGIETHYKRIRKYRRYKVKQDEFCDVLLETTNWEAKRLLKWVKSLEDAYLTEDLVKRLENLIKRIGRFRKTLDVKD